MSTWNDWLSAQAAAREKAGLTRRLRPRVAGESVIDLASNDYLGLATDPRVCAAAAQAVMQYGAGAGASRLVTGSLDLHATLEAELSAWTGHEAGLVFSTGYHANLGIVTALADRNTQVISDAHVHASLIDAIRLSRASVSVVPHNDVEAVRDALKRCNGARVLVVVESIYSVLGDAAPIADLAELCAASRALLVVDEAHGLGVRGPGLVVRSGLAGLPHVVVTATLSKSMGAQGGAVLGSAGLVEHLVNTARPLIFDTGLAPAATAGALEALRIMREDATLGERVLARVRDLAQSLGLAVPDGAVLSIPMPSPQAAVAAQAAAFDAGIRVGCFRPPSVPDGISRLRVTACAGVSDDDWKRARHSLQGIVGKVSSL